MSSRPTSWVELLANDTLSIFKYKIERIRDSSIPTEVTIYSDDKIERICDDSTVTELVVSNDIQWGHYPGICESLCAALRKTTTVRKVKFDRIKYHAYSVHYPDMINSLNCEYVKILEFMHCYMDDETIMHILDTVKVESLSFRSANISNLGQINVLRKICKSATLKEFNMGIISFSDSTWVISFGNNKENKCWVELFGHGGYCLETIDFSDNYILRRSNLECLEPVTKRNRKIQKYVRTVVLTLIMTRKYRNTDLNKHSKEIILRIAQIIYSHKDDIIYLKECDKLIQSSKRTNNEIE